MKDLRKGFCLGATVMACVLAGVSAPASAQSDTSGTPSPLPAVRPPEAPPPAPVPSADASGFAGITAMGKTLANDGVYFQLSYAYDMNSLVSGGFKTGTLPTGELSFGTVLDLQKILGIPEASFHITFDERSGFGLNGNIGTQGPIEANSGPTRATRLSEFFWEQGFDNDRIDIKIGRTNPTLDFAIDDISCEFVSSIICAQPGSWYFSNNNEAYPASTWGGFLNVAATPSVYVRTGIYDDDESQLGANQQGFNWNVKGSSGVFLPLEIGYQTTLSNARYPAHYDIGAYWDDADYATPAGVPMRGRTAAYAQAEQTVWRPNPATRQSLTVFGGGIVYNGGAPYWARSYAGLYDRGPLASRPGDSIGLIGSAYMNNSNETPNKSKQWIFELNYGIDIASGIVLKPYTQYVIAPNNFLAPIGSKEPGNAWVVGFQVSLNLAQFFGFPQFVAY